MRNKELAKRIRELRNRKGFSQEDLSVSSGLSLRTIQRIENGETEPRGDSLKRLADAFDVSPDEIIDWLIVEDNNILKILNVSQFGFIAFPLLGIIIPLAIWILKKDKVKNVDRTGKSIINFQVTWAIVVFTTVLITGVNWRFNLGLPLSFNVLKLIIGGLYLYNTILIIINTVKCYKLRYVYYRPALNILR